MEKIKILVAHPGKQHSLKLAEAISKNDKFDVTYATTVYDKNSSIMMKLVKLVSSKNNKERANARKSNCLNENKVKMFYPFLGLIRIFLAHYDKKQYYFQKATCLLGNIFGKKVAKYAIKNDIDVIISFDTFSKASFEYLDNHSRKKIVKIMDASAANLAYQKKIFEEDMKKTPNFAEKLKEEIAFTLDSNRQNYYIEEAQRADYIIAASTFSKRSYVSVGVPEDAIFVCPYGIECSEYMYEKKKNRNLLTFTFMGGTRQAKGLSYVLEAFSNLNSINSNTKLNIVGKDNLSNDIKEKYSENIDYMGQQLHSRIPEILMQTDIVLFPSLSDGFGFAAAEGMAAGCPVIASENSGIADLIINQVNGFVIPVHSSKALYDKMLWFINHKDKLGEMSESACSLIKQMTWEKYDKSISDVLEKVIMS